MENENGVVIPEEQFLLHYRLLGKVHWFIAVVENGGTDEKQDERYREMKATAEALAAAIDAAMPIWAKDQRPAENGD